MTARWALKHDRLGFISAMNAELILRDPIKIRNVAGVALFDTRETARTVLHKLADADYPVGGYKPVRAVVRVEVVS